MKSTDFTAVMWSQYAAGKEIQRVYRSGIVLDKTKDLKAAALLKFNKLPSGYIDDLSGWPGIDFVPERTPKRLRIIPEV